MIVSAKLHSAGTVILLGLLFLSAAHSATYYVRPTSTNATCPHSPDPCLTLTEYGRNYDQHFNVSAVELKLLPGIHVLEVNFIVANIQLVKLLGNSNSTEVLCTDDVGIVFENVSGLTIDGLMFTSCGRHHLSLIPYLIYLGTSTLYGLFVDSVQHTMITNSTFQNSSGTALAVFNSTAVLENTSFFDNGKRCPASLYSNICQHVSGGGMLVVQSSLNFNGTTLFARNIAFRGGGIYIGETSTVIFSGITTFTNNTVFDGGTGGGINVQDISTLTFSGTSTFVNNSVARHIGHYPCGGGGICAYNYTVVNMNGNTTFIRNTAGTGGGIGAWWQTIVNMNGNTTFESNSAIFYGGGIFAYNHTIVNMTGNTTFESNSAVDGGGIFAYIHTIVNVTGTSTFISNFGGGGGGILATNGSTVYLKGNNHF